MMTYKTKGVCSRAIELELDGDTIQSVHFIGGCDGNTKGIAALVQGMKAVDAIDRLRYYLRFQIHLLPGSTGQSAQAGSGTIT